MEIFEGWSRTSFLAEVSFGASDFSGLSGGIVPTAVPAGADSSANGSARGDAAGPSAAHALQ